MIDCKIRKVSTHAKNRHCIWRHFRSCHSELLHWKHWNRSSASVHRWVEHFLLDWKIHCLSMIPDPDSSHVYWSSWNFSSNSKLMSYSITRLWPITEQSKQLTGLSVMSRCRTGGTVWKAGMPTSCWKCCQPLPERCVFNSVEAVNLTTLGTMNFAVRYFKTATHHEDSINKGLGQQFLTLTNGS